MLSIYDMLGSLHLLINPFYILLHPLCICLFLFVHVLFIIQLSYHLLHCNCKGQVLQKVVFVYIDVEGSCEVEHQFVEDEEKRTERLCQCKITT